MSTLKRMICMVLIGAFAFGAALLLYGCGSKIGDSDMVTHTEIPGLESKNDFFKHLDEKYSDYEEVMHGFDITKKTDLISICYSVWFTKILGRGTKEVFPPNITEILTGNGDWGYDTQFHYWAKPALGYYRSDDKAVIRTHMTQLADAGVDFIIIDYTMARKSWIDTADWKLYVTYPMEAICDTIMKMRSEGKRTPYVVFWSYVNDENGWNVVQELYEQFHTQDKWKDCFVYWESLPFMLTNRIIEAPPEYLTLRAMWGLKTNVGVEEWSFLNIENVKTLDADGFTEQTCVCIAAQESYMTEPTAHGRNHGIFFYTQWVRAFEYRPKVITLTWWNEWSAQLFRDENGNPRFVDNYNMEYSRDIEPVEGGHGDQYYLWTCEYIRAYKEGVECPLLVEEGYESLARQALNM